MVLTAEEKADILVEVLPYIRRFNGKTIVIKYGGHAMVDEAAAKAAIQDTILLRSMGAKPIVVHGGGPEISHAMEKMGKKPKFVAGLRVTDAETLDIVKMVLIGRVNNFIVNEINKQGFKGIGLAGNHGNLICSKKQLPKKVKNDSGADEEVDLGYVGEISCINPDIVDLVTREGYIPVISPIGVDAEGASYNVNADSVAGAIAAAVKATKLIVMTDVPGILRDPKKPSSLMPTVTPTEADRLIKKGTVSAGMIPKVEACVSAVKNGVEEAHIIDGRKHHSLLLEVFTDAGIGTMIKKKR